MSCRKSIHAHILSYFIFSALTIRDNNAKCISVDGRLSALWPACWWRGYQSRGIHPCSTWLPCGCCHDRERKRIIQEAKVNTEVQSDAAPLILKNSRVRKSWTLWNLNAESFQLYNTNFHDCQHSSFPHSVQHTFIINDSCIITLISLIKKKK